MVARRSRALVRLVGGDAGQRRHSVGRALEIERRGQIAAYGPPPRRDVRLVDADARLDETDQRRVVEHLRADPAPGAPRRDYEQRHADAEAVRPDDPVCAARRPGPASEQLVIQRHRRMAGQAVTFGYGPTMWSKNPSFSSNVMIRAVFDHTSGTLVSALRTPAVYQAP